MKRRVGAACVAVLVGAVGCGSHGGGGGGQTTQAAGSGGSTTPAAATNGSSASPGSTLPASGPVSKPGTSGAPTLPAFAQNPGTWSGTLSSSTLGVRGTLTVCADLSGAPATQLQPAGTAVLVDSQGNPAGYGTYGSSTSSAIDLVDLNASDHNFRLVGTFAASGDFAGTFEERQWTNNAYVTLDAGTIHLAYVPAALSGHWSGTLLGSSATGLSQSPIDLDLIEDASGHVTGNAVTGNVSEGVYGFITPEPRLTLTFGSQGDVERIDACLVIDGSGGKQLLGTWTALDGSGATGEFTASQ